MYYSSLISACLVAGASLVSALPSRRQQHYSRSPENCTNTPDSRQCWDNGFDVSCNTDDQWPTTGNTVKYHLELTNQVMAPDGVSKPMMVVNGQYPGPLIEANWGDYIQVTVQNSLQGNGTSMHWHGLRQLNSNEQDGTNGVTECPIPPGQSKTYFFQATAYGPSWYHSHHSVQYSDGLSGPILIHGPTTANYDVDVGVLPLTDWFYMPAFEQLPIVSHAAGPPTADTMLINGSMVSNNGGKYSKTTLIPGKKNLLHLANTGINSYIHVALDNHPFTIVAADFVPIEPKQVDSIVLAAGQRYSVIIDANQAMGNYWLRVSNGFDSTQCDGPNAMARTPNGDADKVRAIFSYEGAPEGEPTSSGSVPSGCYDEVVVPYVKTTVLGNSVPHNIQLGFNRSSADGNLVKWLIDGTPMKTDWKRPTLQSVYGGHVGNFSQKTHVYEINTAPNDWTYWVINSDANTPPLPHPIHLHGHDFWVLSAAGGAFSGDVSSLQLDNPIRRDTATLPAHGHLVLAFKADNPGAWLMHCHIPFHVSGGLGLQFLERKADIPGAIGGIGVLNQECASWNVYADAVNYPELDSGE
ncbi:multicopper oxidase [Aulographum hederae CBS 113979]|uniref:Multicopper oxidase n=1 Tax=Aulographum hederae CBS 113979 TaxID=1176131 RepID=A0A6G1GSY5_9PEZI|nr:multicopper oxidase [Aulographum hederae CBS 113979]